MGEIFSPITYASGCGRYCECYRRNVLSHRRDVGAFPEDGPAAGAGMTDRVGLLTMRADAGLGHRARLAHLARSRLLWLVVRPRPKKRRQGGTGGDDELPILIGRAVAAGAGDLARFGLDQPAL